ncbi:MAG TPA: hypothetical protein VFV58_13465, partial [Blastocatellia bacterium]|nr:hypothetical protein [Blastocatellia bacterium]
RIKDSRRAPGHGRNPSRDGDRGTAGEILKFITRNHEEIKNTKNGQKKLRALRFFVVDFLQENRNVT